MNTPRLRAPRVPNRGDWLSVVLFGALVSCGTSNDGADATLASDAGNGGTETAGDDDSEGEPTVGEDDSEGEPTIGDDDSEGEPTVGDDDEGAPEPEGPNGQGGSNGSDDDPIGAVPTPGSCGALDTFEESVSPAREVFVDESAAGSGDGSADNPYATLDEAFADATPGTAIRIRPGTYAGGTFAGGLEGSAEAPIWIGGVPGESRPLIAGGDNSFQLSGVSFVIVHDLEISGQEANGINVDDGETASGASHDLIFRNLWIHDIGSGGNQDCLKLSGIDRFHVLDSEFEGCSAGSAIDHVGCHQGVVANNVFSDLGGNGVQSKGGSDDILITRNRFINAGERAVNLGGSTGFEFFRPALSTGETNFEARNIRVVANLFEGGVSPIAFVGCVDCLAANNTIIDPEHWVMRILQETTSADGYTFAPASDGLFVNNLIYYALGNLSTQVNVGPDTAADTFTFSNNLWYAYDAPENSAPAYLPVGETDSVYGEDPLLDAASDAAIAAASPAAAAGLELTEVPADASGECYEAPPAIGAREVQ